MFLKPQVRETESAWGSPGLHDLYGVEKGLGFADATLKLRRIFASGDAVMIRAIQANLDMFCDNIVRRKKDKRTNERLSRIEKKLEIDHGVD